MQKMLDVRRISHYFREVYSRYFIDSNGVVYTSLGVGTHRVMVAGERVSISGWCHNNVRLLDAQGELMAAIPQAPGYYLLYTGAILQRLKTRLAYSNSQPNCTNPKKQLVTVGLLRVSAIDSQPSRYYVSRLVAGCFIGDIAGSEVHHVDGDRTNNRVANLQILPFSQHREIHNNA